MPLRLHARFRRVVWNELVGVVSSQLISRKHESTCLPQMYKFQACTIVETRALHLVMYQMSRWICEYGVTCQVPNRPPVLCQVQNTKLFYHDGSSKCDFAVQDSRVMFVSKKTSSLWGVLSMICWPRHQMYLGSWIFDTQHRKLSNTLSCLLVGECFAMHGRPRHIHISRAWFHPSTGVETIDFCTAS